MAGEVSERQLSKVKTDIEKAAEYRLRLQAPLTEVCKVLTEAQREGIIISYQTNVDAMGNHFISLLKTLKELKE
jgi:hypothetical protein